MIPISARWSGVQHFVRQSAPEAPSLVREKHDPGTKAPPQRRNLLVVHLESVSWQIVTAFPEAFPHLHALMGDARTYRRHYASATSTMMILAALLHGNDMEMDSAPGLAPPSGNAPSLFRLLQDAGYVTDMLCATPHPQRAILNIFAESLPPVWKTNNYMDLLERLDRQTGKAGDAHPFAIQVWSQIPHIEASLSIAPYADSLDDLVAGGCAVADTLLGAMLEILRRKGLIETTTIVVFGDHGDDYYTHGFKSGLLHAVEPNAALIHTPLIIRDASLAVGDDFRLVSTIDIAPTCIGLLGLSSEAAFSPRGRSLVEGEGHDIVFSQNFAACQADRPEWDTRKSFAAINRSHLLMVSSRGLEMYSHRLDPGGHGNILHHMELGPDGHLTLPRMSMGVHPHFHTVHHMWRSGSLQESFSSLRQALRAHVEAKAAHVRSLAGSAQGLLDSSAFDRINRHGHAAFFNIEPAPVATRRSLASRIFRIFRRRPRFGRRVADKAAAYLCRVWPTRLFRQSGAIGRRRH